MFLARAARTFASAGGTPRLGLAALLMTGCPAVIHLQPGDGGEGGLGGEGGALVTTSGGSGGAGATGGTGGEGGSPCEPGTPCDPIVGTTFFEGTSVVSRTVAVDGQGDVIVYGSFHDLEVDGEPVSKHGARDVWVAKLDPLTGAPRWLETFGSADWETPTSLAVDAEDNIILTGTTREPLDFGGGPICGASFGQVYLAKLAPDGAHLFSRCLGDPATSTGGSAVSVATTPTGEIVVAGNSIDDLDLGAGVMPWSDGMTFVAAYSPEGDLLWARRYIEWNTDLLDATVRALAVSPTGDLFMAASFRGLLDVEGAVFDSEGDGALVIARLRPDGTLSWARALRGEQINRAALATSAADRLFVSSTRMTSLMTEPSGGQPIDATLVAFDALGGLGLAVDVAGAYQVDQVAVPPSGEILALATVYVDDDPEVVLARLDADGALTSQVSFGRGDGTSLALGGDTLALTGISDAGELDFGAGPLSTEGGAFVGWFVPWSDALVTP